MTSTFKNGDNMNKQQTDLVERVRKARQPDISADILPDIRSAVAAIRARGAK